MRARRMVVWWCCGCGQESYGWTRCEKRSCGWMRYERRSCGHEICVREISRKEKLWMDEVWKEELWMDKVWKEEFWTWNLCIGEDFFFRIDVIWWLFRFVCLFSVISQSLMSADLQMACGLVNCWLGWNLTNQIKTIFCYELMMGWHWWSKCMFHFIHILCL